MLRRRFVMLLVLVAGTAVYSRAFQFDIHVLITRTALAALIYKLPSAWSAMTLQGFSVGATKEITDANKAKDTDDCGDPNDVNVAAKPCNILGATDEGAALLHVMS